MICRHCDKEGKSEEYHKSIILKKQGNDYTCNRCKGVVVDPNNSWYPYLSPNKCSHYMQFEGRCVICSRACFVDWKKEGIRKD